MLNQPPMEHPGAFQISVSTQGRLTTPEQFGNVVVKQTANAVVRLKDVATVDLAAQDYSTNSYLDRDPAIAIGVFQRPGSNALSTAEALIKTMDGLATRLSARAEIHDRLQPDPVHPAVGRRRRNDDRRGDPSRRPGRDPVPANLARRDHPHRRHSGIADRHVFRDVVCSGSR